VRAVPVRARWSKAGGVVRRTRGVVGAVAAVVAPAVGSMARFVNLSGITVRRDDSYGPVTCVTPASPGSAVTVTLSDQGSSITDSRPMTVCLQANPATATGMQDSFAVHDQG
jgi:hypothetical protein